MRGPAGFAAGLCSAGFASARGSGRDGISARRPPQPIRMISAEPTGSPATSLPGRTGPTANLLGVLLLLAAAVVLTGPPRWPARRLVLAGAATLPALVLAAAAATFSLPVIVGLPGGRLGLARDLAAAAVLVAAPLLVPDEPATPPPPARAVVLGVVVLAGMSLWVPATLPRLPGVAAAAVVLAAVALFGRLAPGLRPAVARPATAVAVAAALAAAVLGAIAARP